MATSARKLTVIITGDAKGALGAFAETEAGASGLGSKMGVVAAAIPAVFAAAAVGAGVALFKIGESFDEQYDKIRVGTGKTGEALTGLENDFKAVFSAVPADMADAGDAITILNQKLGLTGEPLQSLSEQFLELSRITKTNVTDNINAVTGAFNLFGIAADDQGGKLDELFRAYQATGVSVSDLAGQLTDAGPQLQAVGFNFDQAATLVAGLGKAGLSVADVMPTLSAAMKAGAHEGKSAQDVYQGLIRSIKDAPSDIEATKIAFDTLGAKAGPKFAELIRSGNFAFDSLGETIAEGSDTIMKAGSDTQDFGEKWTLLKNRVLVALEPVAMRVFNAIGKAIDDLGPIIADMQVKFAVMQQWVEQHWPQIEATIERAVVRIQAVIEGVVAIVQALWDNFGDNIVAYVQAVWPYIQQLIEGVMTTIQGVIDTVLAIIHGDWSKAWQGIQDFLQGVTDQWQAIINLSMETIKAIIGAALEVLSAVWSSVWDAITSAAASAWFWIAATVSDGVGNVISYVESLPSAIADAADGMWDGIADAFRGALNEIIYLWDNFHFPSYTLPSVDLGPLGSFGGGTIGGWSLPYITPLAEGGIVTSPMLALLGDNPSGKEAVVPLEKAGAMGFGGGEVIHIHVDVDGRQIAETIYRHDRALA